MQERTNLSGGLTKSQSKIKNDVEILGKLRLINFKTTKLSDLNSFFFAGLSGF